MKTRQWFGALTVLAVTACSRAEEEQASTYRPVGDMAQLMAGVVEPAAEVIWDAVGVIVDAEGEHHLAPQTDEEWLAVRSAAYTIAESGNLLMMPGRALDQGAWVTMSQELIAMGERAIEAADARNLDAVFDVGAEIYYVCTNCHGTYAIETLRPNDTRTN
jgi:hypothetical protein